MSLRDHSSLLDQVMFSTHHSLKRRFHLAFTLIELLVVMAIILIMMALIGPAMNALKGANDMDRAASDISSMVQICRTYAVANNTYVYLGFDEFDASQLESKTPQIRASGNVGGRVTMIAIASKSGVRHYTPYAVSMTEVQSSTGGWKDSSTGYKNGADFVAISKLQRYENLHLFDYGQTPPASGGMARPGATTLYGSPPLTYLRLGNAASDTVTPITYPFGTGSPQYTFNKVLQFDPDGLVRIAPKGAPTSTAGNQVPYTPQGVPNWLELGLIQTHGNIVPVAQINSIKNAQNIGNHVCLIVDGIKGTVRIFRPQP